MSTSQPNRLFNPHQYLLGPRILEQPSDILHHILSSSASTGLTHLAINNLKAVKRSERKLIVDPKSLVVAVDGIGHGIAVPQLKSSYGVYFGRGSQHNKSAVLPDGLSKSSEVAILSAAYMALDYISEVFVSHTAPPPLISAPVSAEQGLIFQPETGLRKIVILTDSDFLVKSMNEYLFIWEENGYVDRRGKEVVNANEMRDMSDILDMFERLECEVSFWLVGKGSNKESNRLAREALERDEKGEEGGAKADVSVKEEELPRITDGPAGSRS